ncbi:hypothetical protein PF003_g21231 [Phytophthora fragariae]|nr:hypothetical protein PF003_g21231 [Phytophthora fragariae]
MRLLLLSGFIAFASSCVAVSAATVSDEISISKLNANIEAWPRSLAATSQIQRSLRGYAEEVEGEERVNGKAAEKLDDAFATIIHRSPPKIPAGLSGAVLAKFDDILPKVKAAMKNYPEGLSKAAIKQLRQVEEQRIKDAPLIAKVNKKDGKGLYREMELSPGMKVAPTSESLVGRNEQVFNDVGGRMVVCGVVTRPKSEGGGILLISSSKLNKQQFVLPKGGLEKGESLERGMRRELVEEGGVSATFKATLDDTTVGEKTYKSFLMHADETFDQWPESMRYRVWFKWDDAIKMLEGNHPETAAIVAHAREVAKLQ